MKIKINLLNLIVFYFLSFKTPTADKIKPPRMFDTFYLYISLNVLFKSR